MIEQMLRNGHLGGHVDVFKRLDGGDIFRSPQILVATSNPKLEPFLGHSLASVRALEMQAMAEIFPDEGLDHVLDKVPRAQTAIQTTYHIGLFTSQTNSTVPARTVTLASQTGVTEVANSGAYARVSIANSDWGAIATSGSGRRTTSSQKSFAESTGSWGTVNGFFIATNGTHAAGVALCYANFDGDTAAVVNAAGITVRVTPYIHYDG